jgi:putative nucleotidyltransferase with HDIG domain
LIPFIEKCPPLACLLLKSERHAADTIKQASSFGAFKRMSGTAPAFDAATERRLEESKERRQRPLDRREVVHALPFVAGFLVVAVALAVLAEPARELSPAVLLTFAAAFVLAEGIQFSVGAGYAVPTQLVLVPMLLLLPTPYVPLIVAAAMVVSTLRDALRAGIAPGRSLLAVADAWFALSPAVVLVVCGAQTPDLGDWPAYLAALGAQLAVNTGVFAARAVLGGMELPLWALMREMRLAHRVDLLLAPIGFVAALAAADAPVAALLVLALFPLLRGFERERSARIEHSLELGRAYRGTALLLRDLLEEDDEYTGHHTEDVVELTVAVAQAMGVDEDTLREAEMGALLHDIGKIAVPDEIINKPGPLDDDEWAIMKTHTVEGERMLQRVGGLLSSVGVVVRASHERWDGGGYPDGLVAEAIPVAARIISACDAFNAMTTDRSYRKALPLEVAIAELHANAGTQFAPDVVEALVAVVMRDAPAWQLGLAAAPSGIEAQPQPVKQP